MNRIGIWVISLLVVSLTSYPIAAVQKGGQPMEHTKDSLEKVKTMLKEKKAVLVDVRDLVEWNAGHIDGAILLPWRDLQDKKIDEATIRKKIPEGVVVYTYCAVGYRSARAGTILALLKFDVRPLKPGYDDLVKAGFPSAK